MGNALADLAVGCGPQPAAPVEKLHGGHQYDLRPVSRHRLAARDHVRTGVVTVGAFVIGLLVTAFFVSIYVSIIIHVAGDSGDDLSADDPQALGIGGGADFFEHAQLATDREERNLG
jgi:hypothetical protein